MLLATRFVAHLSRVHSLRTLTTLAPLRTMSETSLSQLNGDSSAPATPQNGSVSQNQKGQRPPKAPQPPKKEFKVLMLHGYTQSGPLFRAKTRALEKLLAKSLNPFHTTLTFIYATAPHRLSPTDIPGFVPSSSSPSADTSITPLDAQPDEQPELDSWAWFRRDGPTAPTIRGLPEGMLSVASSIREVGGVDAVVGFSQGGAMAALVAAALEKPHRAPKDVPWLADLREANGGRALRFAVVYSGFWMQVEEIKWCYEPAIRTPTLHYIGGLDTVVSEERSRGLIARCEEPVVAVHPGGHYVPVSREWMMPMIGFVRKFVEEDVKARV